MTQTALRIGCLLAAATGLFAADPQLLNMAPANTQMFAGINVEQARNSQFGQFLLANLPISTELEEFVHTTGFDPRTDLREILIVTTTAPQPGVTPHDGGLLLAKGNFNIPQIVAAAQKDGKATVSTYAGAQLISYSEGKQTQALGLADTSTAVAGEIGAVKAALDARSRTNVIAPAVMTRINQLGATEDAWSLSTANFGAIPLPGLNGGGNGSGSAVLQSIQQASGGIKFGSMIQMDAQAVTGTPQDATSLGDVVKLLAQMVQMHSSDNPVPGQLTDMLKSMIVSTEGNILKVSLALPEDQLENMFKMAEEHHGGAHGKI